MTLGGSFTEWARIYFVPCLVRVLSFCLGLPIKRQRRYCPFFFPDLLNDAIHLAIIVYVSMFVFLSFAICLSLLFPFFRSFALSFCASISPMLYWEIWFLRYSIGKLYSAMFNKVYMFIRKLCSLQPLFPVYFNRKTKECFGGPPHRISQTPARRPGLSNRSTGSHTATTSAKKASKEQGLGKLRRSLMLQMALSSGICVWLHLCEALLFGLAA